MLLNQLTFILNRIDWWSARPATTSLHGLRGKANRGLSSISLGREWGGKNGAIAKTMEQIGLMLKPALVARLIVFWLRNGVESR